MGRRVRDERREKREDYAAKISKSKRKTTLMATGILVVIALIVGYSGYVFVTMDADVPGAPPGAGRLGGEHEHASLLVRIFDASSLKIFLALKNVPKKIIEKKGIVIDKTVCII